MAKKAIVPAISAGFRSTTALIQTLNDINNSLDNTLSRDGSTPNAMNADLDMNSFGITNLNSIDAENLRINGEQVSSLFTVVIPDWQGAWVTGFSYSKDQLVRENGNVYICLEAHVSTTFSTDLTANRWELFAPQGPAGAGTGDLLASNNLSDVDDPNAAISNLGLGPVATDTIVPISRGGTGVTSLGELQALTGTSPIGEIIMWPSASAPTGFLKCDGSPVSRSQYQDLFTVIGTEFGSGDGTSTFNLPDLRGEFVRGFDDGRGVDNNRILNSNQSDSAGPHRHFITANGLSDGQSLVSSTESVAARGRPGYPFGSDSLYALTGQPDEANIGRTSENNSGGETRPRNVALVFCIRWR